MRRAAHDSHLYLTPQAELNLDVSDRFASAWISQCRHRLLSGLAPFDIGADALPMSDEAKRRSIVKSSTPEDRDAIQAQFSLPE